MTTHLPSGSVEITPSALRARREAVGLTRNQLAGRAGCSMSAIANAELGYVPKRSAVLARVVETLRELEQNSAKAA